MIKYANLFQKNINFWGADTQDILRKSSILIAGCGGLGSVVSENLVRSGIGKLVLIDYDKVEVSNLNRQILFDTDDVGSLKTAVTKRKLEKINPFCEIQIINEKLSEKTDLSHFQFDGIADCLDNFESRFFLENKITEQHFLVHGGVAKDFGQVTTIIKNKTKKLAEIFQGSNYAGNEGVAPQIVNIIGSIMSNEIIDNLLGNSKLLNKILVFELQDFSLEFINLK